MARQLEPPPWARRALAQAGLLAPDASAIAMQLGGGVSAQVLLVVAAETGGRWVVKRPRERFDVTDEWIVPTRRAHAEAEASRLFSKRLPRGTTAPLVALQEDEGGPVLVFKAAPENWRPWKDRLLSGEMKPRLAHAVGLFLARLHALGAGLGPDVLRHDELFRAQRIDPYLVTAGRRVPDAMEPLRRLEESFFARDDLVHGDFSPKNLLVSRLGDRFMIVDHEVVTRGDAAFDLAFLWTHLALKSVHQPALSEEYLALAEGSRDGYLELKEPERPDPVQAVGRALAWVPALLLARCVGKSPAEYLSATARERVSKEVLVFLHEPPADLQTIWAGLVRTVDETQRGAGGEKP